MPIAAIAIAAVADFGAAGAFAAIGTAAFTVTDAFVVMGAVGATVAAVGAVTHDKTLSTIGMVIGGIGAVGGLASAAGIFGSDALSATDAAINDTATAANSAVGNDVVGQLNASVGTAADSAAASMVGAAAANTFDSLAGSVTGQAVGNALPGVGNNVQMAIQPGSLTGAVPNQTPGPSGLLGTPKTVAAADLTPQVPFSPSMPDIPPPGIWSKLGESMMSGNNLGLVAMGGVQTLGSLVSGATNPMTPAQIAQMSAQAAQNQAAANLQTQQNINMGQPVPTATRTALPNVTGAPAGIINAPGSTGKITGTA